MLKSGSLIFSLILFAGCSGSEFAFQADGVIEASDIDPSQSTIEVVSPVLADGRSESLVTLKIRNSRGFPVKNWMPVVTASGQGVVIAPCVATDENGHSTCRVLSTVAETKEIWINGIRGLLRQVVFERPPPNVMLFSFVSNAGLQRIPSGHIAITAGGIPETPTSIRDSNQKLRVRTSHLGTLIDPEGP